MQGSAFPKRILYERCAGSSPAWGTECECKPLHGPRNDAMTVPDEWQDFLDARAR